MAIPNAIAAKSLLGRIVPAETRALLTYPNGRLQVVDGPRWVPPSVHIAFFERRIIPQGERGYYYSETGVRTEVIGPAVLYLHPLGGRYVAHRPFVVAPDHAMVVIDEHGGRHIYPDAAADVSQMDHTVVWLKDGENIHRFRWTGSPRGQDTMRKVPGALVIEQLRLQRTQTYVEYDARTRDNVPLTVRIMIDFDFGPIGDLLKNDDPMGMMFNRVGAAILARVAELPFDEFKENTGQKIGEIDTIADEQRRTFVAFGLIIHDVVVLGWTPQDREVSEILSQAAMLNTRRGLDEAEHERRMAELGHREQQLSRQQQLAQLESENAQATGDRRAEEELARLNRLQQFFAERLGNSAEAARIIGQLTLMEQAAHAQTLTITPEFLAIAPPRP